AVRIGISTGRIAVGKTGPTNQWHISVFGSVANLGARLERIAKEFRVPVLVSGETFQRANGLGDRRFRQLCLIRPAGFEESYPIYELVLPRELGGSGVTPDEVARYEEALASFINREWEKALEQLQSLPASDPATEWLITKVHRFRENPPPAEWGGEIPSLSK
ncbi:MAG: adenylate/guanylate cyclase domain-containing protein, partial [Verrucomicrobiota bacterium]